MEAFGNKPIGSGAFKVKSYVHGQHLELVRNEHYWKKGRPYLDGLTFNTVPNDTTRILSVESGQAQLGASVPFAQVADVSHHSGVHVANERFAAIYSVWLNETYPPLADVRIRRALNYATPKEEILKTVFFGLGTIANDVLPAVKFWDRSVPAYPYSISKAKAAIAASSHSKGFALTVDVPAGDTVSQQVSQILKAQWAQIGVNVTINQVDLGTDWSKWLAGNAQASMFPPNAWTADLPVDDSTSLSVLDYSTGAKAFYTYYKSPMAESYAETASRSTSDSVRPKNFNSLQALAMSDAVTVPICFVPSLTAVRNNVQGFATLLNGWWRFENVWLS